MRPEDQSLTRDLSKTNNFYIEYMVTSGNVMLLFTYHMKVMKSGAALFSGSFTSLRGKDGIRNQFVLFFEVCLALSVLFLLRAPYGQLFPAYECTCTPVLNAKIQVLCSINLGKLSEV